MKVKLLIMALLCASYVSASDVIVTKDSKKIESKVLKVSADEIEYKKASNLEGPTFVVKTSEILTVIYDNGEVEIFQGKEEKQPVAVEAESKQELADSSSDAEKLQNSSKDVLGFKSLNGVRIASYDYKQYLKEHCLPAYSAFDKGNRLFGAGWACFTIGKVFQVVGIVLCVQGAQDEDGRTAAPGGVFITLGSIANIVSIPLIISGGVKRGRSIAIYNDQCAEQSPKAYLNVNVNNNGLGLALNF